jgi:hypothetical protein
LGDAIVNDDGSLATSPISLVEVQGYAYLAKTTLADLYRRAGESGRAEQLRQEAEELRARFLRPRLLARGKGHLRPGFASPRAAGSRRVIESGPGPLVGDRRPW